LHMPPSKQTEQARSFSFVTRLHRNEWNSAACRISRCTCPFKEWLPWALL
jgi:hypothetical protein